MKNRPFWLGRIEQAWKRRSLVWLSGVRRAGKTTLCRSLTDVEYFDCELPRVRRLMEDPQDFLEGVRGRRIVLDEIHRLENPSELLKIAAGHFPHVSIVATASSTLGASSKFRDTLAGRKAEIWLTPMTLSDIASFGRYGLSHRFLHGGLPPFFLAEPLPEADFQEWMDAYWAKDIQELFRLERRSSFRKFVEMIMANSGSVFEATRYAAPCEISRTTVANYLSVLEATLVAHVLRPFSTHKPTEIVSAPKVYGFDTGFVCCYKGWHDLRREDMGVLWEHFVLNELYANLQTKDIRYWRDKRGHEVDFVLIRRGRGPIAIECKWSASAFDPAAMKAFGREYPKAESWVVARDVDRAYHREYEGVRIRFAGLSGLVNAVTA